MFILALDQSTSCTGFSYWQDEKFLTSGIVTSKTLKQMYFQIENLIDKFQPDMMVIEDVYFTNSTAKSYHALAQLQGMIISICYKENIPLYIVTANQWKKIFGVKLGPGQNRDIQKEQTMNIVRNKYKIDVSNDEADSIGIGYWFLHETDKSKIQENLINM